MTRAIIFLIILTLSISCEEPEPIDPRDEWVGSYDYQMRYFNEDLTTKTGVNSGIDIVSYLHFEKTSEPGRFNLKLDGTDLAVHAHSLTVSESGHTFSIEDQTNIPGRPDLLLFGGFANVNMDGGQHQGVLNTHERRIHYYLKVVVPNETYFIEIDGVRR